MQQRFESQLQAALGSIDWAQFDWARDCQAIHKGSMKVVGRLSGYPTVAIASTLFPIMEGEGSIIHDEIKVLSEIAAHGVRTLGFSDRVLSVPSYAGDGAAHAYLLQYFSLDDAFVYEEGEPGTEDHFIEPMRKLRILENDEGDWTMNRDTIRIVSEHHLEESFLQDLRSYVELILHKAMRINDYQGVLANDGHFYVCDPLHLEKVEKKVNRYLLEGVFRSWAVSRRRFEPRPH